MCCGLIVRKIESAGGALCKAASFVVKAVEALDIEESLSIYYSIRAGGSRYLLHEHKCRCRTVRCIVHNTASSACGSTIRYLDHNILLRIAVLLLSTGHVEAERENVRDDEDDRAPVERGGIDVCDRWKCEEDDEEDVVDEGDGVRRGPNTAKTPARMARKLSSVSCTECASMRDGIRHVQGNQLARNDGVKSDRRSKVDACQRKCDEARKEDGVSRWVSSFRDLYDVRGSLFHRLHACTDLRQPCGGR